MARRSRAVAEVGLLLAKPNVPRTINVGSYINCTDNSGAQVLRVVNVMGVKPRLRRQPAACVGDLVAVTVKKGDIELRRKVLYAVIVRQKKPYRRADGTWISFEDTAGVVVTQEGDVKATEIRGPVAREAAERWPKIANLASIIV
ncbi:MAG: 50S ribosomal protein L14 [Thaumarchaeota archaeon]|nr:50S ribosomal protein L14 [Candidatus Calditenuaceae archaeon]MDW8186781.1 50S ribosomal protein L14 [Nitrososphaerota archaeon]